MVEGGGLAVTNALSGQVSRVGTSAYLSLFPLQILPPNTPLAVFCFAGLRLRFILRFDRDICQAGKDPPSFACNAAT
jgi:hypothetical protein